MECTKNWKQWSGKNDVIKLLNLHTAFDKEEDVHKPWQGMACATFHIDFWQPHCLSKYPGIWTVLCGYLEDKLLH